MSAIETGQMELSEQRERFITGPWTSREIAVLREHAHLGAAAVAVLLGRSTRAVRAQAARLRISIRRAGERRGLILGQPRGESWGSRRDAARIREAVLAGEVDPAAVEELLARIAAGEEIPMCPRCTARAADHRSGVCRVCHMKALSAAHRDAEALRAAQRDLWQARTEKSRAQRALGSSGD